MAYDPLEMQRQKMSGYPNSETIGQENQQILAQNAAKAAAFAQAANQPAPATQPNPEVAEFAAAKQNYNMFAKQPETVQQQAKPTPTQTVIPPKNTNNPVNVHVSNAKPVDQPIRSMDDLANAMGYTSPEQEEKLRKASVANQRIVAVADALRQIGNIYNTTRYAPSQQFNSPVELERQRYLQGKALRDRANQTYISYQQAKAAQDAKQRQWEAEYGYKQGLLDHYRDQEARLRDKDAFDKENKEARRDLDREKFELDKAYKQGKINIAQYNAQTSRIRAVKAGRAGGGGGGKYWAYDPEGNIHYYPNRTMWEQGIAEFGSGYPQTETLTNTNAIGDQTQRQVKVKPTTTGGALARKAHGNSAVSGFSIRNNNQGNQKGTNVSRFTIHK